MSMAIRLTAWGALLSVIVLSASRTCVAADETRLEITGKLIKPPCIASFPATQSVEIPAVSLNSLTSKTADWTYVALGFECTAGSQVQLRLTAGSGTYDADTMRTTLDNLGLITRLSDVTRTAHQVDKSLGEPLIFKVQDTALNLQLSVKPVQAEQVMPAVGTYSATLMMEIVYL
ncbi:fimbrial protein [Pseudomonas sp. SWRI153]|uniref:Fimbrial protein n=1 Tax=Pseudomonas khorasanensis TaxID=2745508 RepID=A0A923JDU5_9PSED|nr:fimbrial protein [Pseudomonas khorasanensis]MBV4484737.1 fimbrial protein [Pseudomonas khorasanensis]